MSAATITISGRLTHDPKLRFIPSGDAVASFSVAVNERKFDKATGQWVEGEALFLEVEAWRQLGEGAAERLERGSFVTVVGTLRPNNWTKDDGVEKKGMKVVATEIGLTVRAGKPASSAREATATAVQEPAW